MTRRADAAAVGVSNVCRLRGRSFGTIGVEFYQLLGGKSGSEEPRKRKAGSGLRNAS